MNNDIAKVVKFNYNKNRQIEIYYDKSRVEEYLKLVNNAIKQVDNLLDKLEISDKQKDKVYAMEAEGSSSIEGYETYNFSSKIVNKEKLTTKKEKITYEGYEAYKKLTHIPNVDVVDTKEKILEYWRILLKHNKLHNNFRIMGVKVGSGLKTSHVAPKSKYVKPLIEEMISVLNRNDADRVLQSILAHYMFTWIHPFIDGNGRTARLINQSYLIHETKIGKRGLCIPLSLSILRCRNIYYYMFKEVRRYRNNEEYDVDLTNFIICMCCFILKALQMLVDELNIDVTEIEKIDTKIYKILTNKIELKPVRRDDKLEVIECSIDKIEEKHIKLNNRQSEMVEYLKKELMGTYADKYMKQYNKMHPHSKIDVDTARADIGILVNKGILIKDERYTLYSGYKYWNK